MMKDEGNTILHNLHSNHKSRARPVKEEAELEEWEAEDLAIEELEEEELELELELEASWR